MKTFYKGLLYDTEKLDLIFDLDNEPEKNTSPFTNSGTSPFTNSGLFTYGSLFTTTFTVVNGEIEDKKNYTYKTFIAKTPQRNKYIIITEKRVKVDTGEEIKISRTINRFFDNVNEVRDYICEYYGVNEEYDKKIEELLTQIGADFQEA